MDILKERPQNQATLCLALEETRILLGMKKRGFGVGKYNGFGGKPQEEDESIEHTALREFQEESGLSSELKHLEKVAELDFYFPHKTDWHQTVHVYLIRTYSGNPVETEEMAFKWFDLNNIPYHSMWDDDKHWLPLTLQGKKLRASFIFREQDGDNVVDYKKIEEVDVL